MRTDLSAIAFRVLCGCMLTTPAFAQANAAEAPIDLSPTTLLAAVRDYPPDILDAVIELSRYPSELERLLAGGDATFEGPRQLADAIPQGTPAGFRSAVMRLLNTPELLFIANVRPEEIDALRRLREEAPDGFEVRRRQLQSGYEASAIVAARAWQDVLERDPAALSAYRDLLEKFCENRLKLQPDFVCVDVVKREYYYACVPNDALIAFAFESDAPASLRRALEQWDRSHGSEVTDERVAALRADERIRIDLSRGSIYEIPAAARGEMWRGPGKWGGVSIGRIPVAVQPPEDQPAEARLAFAIAETARLWSLIEEPQGEPGAGPPVAAAEEPIDNGNVVYDDDGDDVVWVDDDDDQVIVIDDDYYDEPPTIGVTREVVVYDEPYIPAYSAGFYYSSYVTPYYCGPSGFFSYRSYGPRTYCSPLVVYGGSSCFARPASAYGHSGLSLSLYGGNWRAGFSYGRGVSRYSSGAIQFNNDGRRRYYVNYGYPTRPDRTFYRDRSGRSPTVIRSSPNAIRAPSRSGGVRSGTTIQRSGTSSSRGSTVQRSGSSSSSRGTIQRSGSGSRSGSGVRPSGSGGSSTVRPKSKSDPNPIVIRPTGVTSSRANSDSRGGRSSASVGSSQRSSSLAERVRQAVQSRSSSSGSRSPGVSSRSSSPQRSSGSAVRSGSRTVTRSSGASASRSSSRSSSSGSQSGSKSRRSLKRP